MTTDVTSVFVLLTGANEGSTPLEAANAISACDISITVCDFFEESSEPQFDVDVLSLGAASKYDISGYQKLYQELTAQEPDILHIHPNAVGAIARIIGKIAGVPNIISTEHSQHSMHSWLKRVVNGGTNWLNDVVICNSQTTAQSFTKWEDLLLTISDTRKSIIHYGANVDAIERAVSSCESPDLPDGFLIGTAGRLAYPKNPEVMIKSGTELIREHPDIQIVFAGDGPKRESLEQLSRDYGIEDHVHFLGWISQREQVYAYMDQLDIFVFPSLVEGFGVANVEAMAIGTPVVVNDIPVLREVVGDAGIYVDATETGEVVEAISNLYTDDTQRQHLGAKASERIRQLYSLKECEFHHDILYRTLHEDKPCKWIDTDENNDNGAQLSN